jgi:hypothetical protein
MLKTSFAEYKNEESIKDVSTFEFPKEYSSVYIENYIFFSGHNNEELLIDENKNACEDVLGKFVVNPVNLFYN